MGGSDGNGLAGNTKEGVAFRRETHLIVTVIYISRPSKVAEKAVRVDEKSRCRSIKTPG